MFFLLVWLRKVQYDSIVVNLKDLGKIYEGKVVRPNPLTRPYFKGRVNGKEITIGFTSERSKGKRDIYIHYTIACNSNNQLSIISSDWYERRKNTKDDNFIELLGGKFLLQSRKKLSPEFVKQIEKIISGLPEFAYILVAQTGIIMERISNNLIDDTKLELNQKIIQILHEFSKKLTRK